MSFRPRRPARLAQRPGFVSEPMFLSDIEEIPRHNPRRAARNARKRSNWPDQGESGDYDHNAGDDALGLNNRPQTAPFVPAYRRDCTACTRGRMVCSFRTGGDLQQPCVGCVRLNRECVPPTPRPTRGYGPPPALEGELPTRSESSAPPSRAVEKPLNCEVQLPPTFRFCTRLAHPIEFNFQPMGDDDPIACHWCNSMDYGIIGLGVVHVLAFDAGNDRGYVEVEQGHTADGHLPSRMCVSCTTTRVSILACRVHEMQELPIMEGVEIDQETQDRQLALNFAPFEWCAVCPNAAYYACRKGGVCSDNGSSPAEVDDCGCGLRLCTGCMVQLVGNHDGDLTEYLTQVFLHTSRGVDGTFGLRADADFLHPYGELMRRARPSPKSTPSDWDTAAAPPPPM